MLSLLERSLKSNGKHIEPHDYAVPIPFEKSPARHVSEGCPSPSSLAQVGAIINLTLFLA